MPSAKLPVWGLLHRIPRPRRLCAAPAAAIRMSSSRSLDISGMSSCAASGAFPNSAAGVASGSTSSSAGRVKPA